MAEKQKKEKLHKWLENEHIQKILANSDHVRNRAQACPATDSSLTLRRREIFQ